VDKKNPRGAIIPTELGKAYTREWRGKPPHMLDVDVPIWWRFLEKWGFQLMKIYYDCLLGGPIYTAEQMKDPMLRMWRKNLAKRADAIAELEDQVWIIEVAQSPGLRALGQLQTYRALWVRDPKIAKPEKPILVCDILDPDLAQAVSMYGISIFAV